MRTQHVNSEERSTHTYSLMGCLTSSLLTYTEWLERLIAHKTEHLREETDFCSDSRLFPPCCCRVWLWTWMSLVSHTLLASFLLSSSATASFSCLWKFHGGILTVSTISTNTNMMQTVSTQPDSHTSTRTNSLSCRWQQDETSFYQKNIFLLK